MVPIDGHFTDDLVSVAFWEFEFHIKKYGIKRTKAVKFNDTKADKSSADVKVAS